MSFVTIEAVLGSAVATSGTFAVTYPDGYDAGAFQNGVAHKFSTPASNFDAPGDFTIAFGATQATITWLGATTLPAGTPVWVQLDIGGSDADVDISAVKRTNYVQPVVVDLGAPDTADADGVCASQAITAAGTGTIAGALASSGVATFDQPRNVVAAWTGTAVMTVTGTDEYGSVLVESSASGTALAGKKAFKTITAVDASADVTSATVGSGDVLGLPVHLPSVAMSLAEIEDGAAATAGTYAAGISVASTPTTGDVRGTYNPDTACDGSAQFSLILALPDPDYLGLAQYAA
ncbi:MAG: hypothetical protein JKY94_00955 [Rhodobacteraceae bacterium]|nr:hypothetical protein [Paracoccaceae bacterium]